MPEKSFSASLLASQEQFIVQCRNIYCAGWSNITSGTKKTLKAALKRHDEAAKESPERELRILRRSIITELVNP